MHQIHIKSHYHHPPTTAEHLPMPPAYRFTLETVDDQEAQRRIERELALEMMQAAPMLLKTIDVIEGMAALGFAHTGNLRDGTLTFFSAGNDSAEIYLRRDWHYAGVRYLVCCWNAEGRRPCRRVASLPQLRRAVRTLVAVFRFRKNAWRRLAVAEALHPRLGQDALVRVLGLDMMRMCLAEF